jgi:hypothetical protein
LNDGAVLEQGIVSSFGNEGEQPTAWIKPPIATNPQQQNYGGQMTHRNWAQQPPKKSGGKGCLWAFLITAVVGAIGVVALFAGLIYIGSQVEEAERANKSRNISSNSDWKGSDSKPASKGEVKKDDLSRWRTGDFNYGKLSYADGKLTAASSKKGYYSAILGFRDQYTNDTITRITVENKNSALTELGFGLIVNSSPSKPLLSDYTFVIRTVGKPGFRVYQHENNKEKVLVDWTPLNSIKGGSAPNRLEARDEGGKIIFYVNDVKATSIEDKFGDASSIIGIYAADGIPIMFSDIEIEK